MTMHVGKSIRWKKTPGRTLSLAASPGGAAYAESEDKRFVIWVSRWLRGAPGSREYAVSFSALDYGIPNQGHRFTEIPIPATHRTNPKKVMADVEKWAEEHPLEETTASRVLARYTTSR